MSRALWHISPSCSELRYVSHPENQSLQKVHALYSMVSTGTERLVARGEVDADCDELMSVPSMEGSFDLPIKYGYSLVGSNEAGEILHCMHPHQSTVYVANDSVYLLPEGVPARRMALLSNMETAITAIWDAGIDDFRDVAVCGFGSIGSLLASALRLTSDADPVVVEADSWRRSRATELGFQTCEPSQLHDEFNVCFNTTGSALGLQWCIDHASTDGTVVELSWYGKRSVTLALGQRFHYNRIRIVSSQVSTIPVHMQERFGIADRKKMSAELLSDDCFDELITNEIAFEESPQFFDLLRRGGQGDGVVWVIKY